LWEKNPHFTPFLKYGKWNLRHQGEKVGSLKGERIESLSKPITRPGADIGRREKRQLRGRRMREAREEMLKLKVEQVGEKDSFFEEAVKLLR